MIQLIKKVIHRLFSKCECLNKLPHQPMRCVACGKVHWQN